MKCCNCGVHTRLTPARPISTSASKSAKGADEISGRLGHHRRSVHVHNDPEAHRLSSHGRLHGSRACRNVPAPAPHVRNPVHGHTAGERAPRHHRGGSVRARLLDRRELQRRFARRTQGADRVRALLRAHDVQGVRERRPRRASVPDVHVRRQHERDDQQGPDGLLRDPAGQPARSRPVSRSRPDAIARDHQREPREPAERGAGRAAAGRRQPALWEVVRGARRARLRQRRLRTLGDRFDGRSQRRDGRRRRRVFQDATTRPTTPSSRSSATSRRRRRWRRCGSISARFPGSRRRRPST